MPPPMWKAPPPLRNRMKSRIILTKSPKASSSSKSCVAPRKKLSPKMSSSSYLCGNQPVSQVILRNIAWTFVSLHAIEPTRPRGRRRVDGVESPRHRADAATEARRVDGVGRPKFDFHTASYSSSLASPRALRVSISSAEPIFWKRAVAVGSFGFLSG